MLINMQKNMLHNVLQMFQRNKYSIFRNISYSQECCISASNGVGDGIGVGVGFGFISGAECLYNLQHSMSEPPFRFQFSVFARFIVGPLSSLYRVNIGIGVPSQVFS